MSEVDRINFSFKEVATAIVKQQGLHEGLWGVFFEFGLGAANVPGPDEGLVLPAAIVPVLRMGIQRFSEENNLTVDASKVNKELSARVRQRKQKVEAT